METAEGGEAAVAQKPAQQQPELSSGSKKRARRAGLQPDQCQVPDCKNELELPYHKKYHICATCFRTPSIMIAGQEQRFCQKCGHFEPLGVFTGLKRTCQVALDHHNARRRAQKARLRAAGAERPSAAPAGSSATASGSAPALQAQVGSPPRPVASPDSARPPAGLGPLRLVLEMHTAGAAGGSAVAGVPDGAGVPPGLHSALAAPSLLASAAGRSGVDGLQEGAHAVGDNGAGLGVIGDRPLHALLDLLNSQGSESLPARVLSADRSGGGPGELGPLLSLLAGVVHQRLGAAQLAQQAAAAQQQPALGTQQQPPVQRLPANHAAAARVEVRQVEAPHGQQRLPSLSQWLADSQQQQQQQRQGQASAHNAVEGQEAPRRQQPAGSSKQTAAQLEASWRKEHAMSAVAHAASGAQSSTAVGPPPRRHDPASASRPASAFSAVAAHATAPAFSLSPAGPVAAAASPLGDVLLAAVGALGAPPPAAAPAAAAPSAAFPAPGILLGLLAAAASPAQAAAPPPVVPSPPQLTAALAAALAAVAGGQALGPAQLLQLPAAAQPSAVPLVQSTPALLPAPHPAAAAAWAPPEGLQLSQQQALELLQHALRAGFGGSSTSGI